MTGAPTAGAARGAVAVAAWGVHLPDLPPGRLPGPVAGEPACPPDRARELLGAKGLLSKEPATRLALCAVHRALALTPRAPKAKGPPDPSVAVVASSNLGSVATVEKVVRTLRAAGLKEVSALDAPNASSNVMASTVAIWFRFGGPNLMVCSGATSGLDAVYVGSTLLRSRRADRVIVVGAEPDDPAARRLHASRSTGGGAPLRAGGAAVVLTRSDLAPPGAPVLGAVRPGQPREDDGGVATMIGPAGTSARAERTIDLTAEIGDTYGALGVLQIAVAAALIAAPEADRPREVLIVCGDDTDGWRTATVHAPDDRAGRGLPS